MTLWVVVVAVSAAAAVLSLAPLLRRIGADQALAASGVPDSSGLRLTTLAVAGVATLGAVTLYAAGGRPEPSPRAAEPRPPQPSVVEQLNAAMSRPVAGAFTNNVAVDARGKRLDGVDVMIARLAARLEREPGDVEGWRMLGWSYLRTGRPEQAAQAYARAVALNAGSATLKSAYGEALVRASGGTVTKQAREIFADVLKADKSDPRARFFVALAKHENGNSRAAIDDWIALLEEAPQGEEWSAGLRQRIVDVARESGVDLAGRLRENPATGTVGSAANTRGPSEADVRAASTMSAADRQAMIREMVDRLDDRLSESPQDVEGWARLIRSRMVLGERSEAHKALQRGMDVFADDTASRQWLVGQARRLGVTPE